MLENDLVSTDTLKEQGFTDEDLQAFTSKEEPAEIPTETIETPIEDIEVQVEQVEETSQTDSDIVSKLKPTVIAYDRFKEINDKNKVLAAEIAALKAQQSQPTPQTQPTAPIQQPTTNISIDEQIEKIADGKAREKLKIDSTVDVDDYSWQIENSKLYREYLKVTAKEEFKLENQYAEQSKVYKENESFVAEMQSQPDFNVVYQFALNELDEIPGKKSKVITAALYNVDRGIASKEDMAILKDFTSECRAKMTGITTQSPTTDVSMPTPSPLDKAIGLPRATTLSGAKTSSMSMVEVERLINDGKFDQIPKDILRMIDPNLVK